MIGWRRLGEVRGFERQPDRVRFFGLGLGLAKAFQDAAHDRAATMDYPHTGEPQFSIDRQDADEARSVVFDELLGGRQAKFDAVLVVPLCLDLHPGRNRRGPGVEASQPRIGTKIDYVVPPRSIAGGDVRDQVRAGAERAEFLLA